jgi:hypothetical protein
VGEVRHPVGVRAARRVSRRLEDEADDRVYRGELLVEIRREPEPAHCRAELGVLRVQARATCWLAGVVVALAMACKDDGDASTDGGTSSTAADMPADDGVLYDVGAGANTDYLVVLWTPFNELPLQFVADIAIEVNGGVHSLQPLALDLGSTSEPRTPAGPPWVPTTTQFNVGSDVTARFDEIVVPAEANPWNGEPYALEYFTLLYTPHPGNRCSCGLGLGEGVVANLHVGFEGAIAVMGLADPDERPTMAEITECTDAAENC